MSRRNSPLRKAARAVGRGPSDAASPRGFAMGDARLMIQDAGVDVANRRVLNVIGATSIVDNPATGAVDLTVTSGGGSIRVSENGTPVCTRPELNFIGGGTVNLSVVDNGVDNQADITISTVTPATLAALEATALAADKLPYYISGVAAGTTDLTSFARTLLDDTTAAAARTTLGIGGSSGVAEVNFGSFPGASDTSVAVTGQADILSGSVLQAWLYPLATADHSADEHRIETISVSAGDIVAAAGFTIWAQNTSQLNEPLNSLGIGRVVTKAATSAFGNPAPSVGGQGTRLHGRYSVAWRWS